MSIMDYSFKQKNKLWGLIDKHKNWVVQPQYDGIVYDEYIGPDNVFIFKKQNKYYLYTSQLQNLYPEGITDYWFLNEDFNISGYDKNEYAFLVRGENGLFGISFNFEKQNNNIKYDYKLNLKTEWNEILNISDVCVDLIKGDDIYYAHIYNGIIKIFVEDYTHRSIYSGSYYSFIKNNPNLELPEFASQMSKNRFCMLVYLYFNKSKYSDISISGYRDVCQWIETTFTKKNLYGLFDWLFLKLFVNGYDGKKLPKKYKRH